MVMLIGYRLKGSDRPAPMSLGWGTYGATLIDSLAGYAELALC